MADQETRILDTVFTHSVTSFTGKSPAWTAVFLAAITSGKWPDEARNLADRAMQTLGLNTAEPTQNIAKPSRGQWVWTRHTSDEERRTLKMFDVEENTFWSRLCDGTRTRTDMMSESVDIVDLVRAALCLDPNSAITLDWNLNPFDGDAVHQPRLVEVKVESRPVTSDDWAQLAKAGLPMIDALREEKDRNARDTF